MKVNCKELGGPVDCLFVAEGKDAEEVIVKLNEHINVAHPAMAETMKKMTPAELADWTAETTAKMHP